MTTLDPFAARNGGAPFTPPADRGRGARVHPRQRHRVPVRAVRRHARQAEREARPGLAPRRPADRGRRLRRLRRRRHRPVPELAGHGGDARRAQPHAAAVPLRASPASPATSTSRARSGRTARARSSAASSTAPRRSATSSRSAAELEYFLVRKKDDGTIELADPLDTLDQPCYDMRALTRSLDFVSQVARNITSLGWDNYATDHEDANGQFEQNFQFADALTTADRAIFFRYMVESMAQERGLIATFMPKPFAHLTGNGCHFHMSLWKDGENVFERRPVRRPARHGPVGDRLPLHRRPEGAREGVHRGDRADRDLLQAARHEHDAQRLDVGPGLHQLRVQQPHPDAAHPGAPAASRTAPSTAPATRTSPRR